MSDKDAKDRFIDMVLENGVALSLAVAFCWCTYFVMDRYNTMIIELFVEAVDEMRAERNRLLDELLDCRKQNDDR